jgi:hypothetical protein
MAEDKSTGVSVNLAIAFFAAAVLACIVAWHDICTDLSGVWRTAKISVFVSMGLDAVALTLARNGSIYFRGRFVLAFGILLMIMTVLQLALLLHGGFGM